MALLVGGAYGRLVDRDAQARAVGACERAALEAEGFRVGDVVEQFGVLVVVDADGLFLDEEVGGGEGDLEAGGECDRPSGQCGASWAP